MAMRSPALRRRSGREAAWPLGCPGSEFRRSQEPMVFCQSERRQSHRTICAPPTTAADADRSAGPSRIREFEPALRATAGIGQYAATKHAMKAVADSLRDEVNANGVRVMSLFLGRTASERQRGIFAAEGRPYPPERLIQPADVAGLVLFLLRLPRTSEVTDIVLRPMQKT